MRLCKLCGCSFGFGLVCDWCQGTGHPQLGEDHSPGDMADEQEVFRLVSATPFGPLVGELDNQPRKPSLGDDHDSLASCAPVQR